MTFKRTLQILVGVALTMQLTGCFFEDDHRWHGEHHEHNDSGVDVHVHG